VIAAEEAVLLTDRIGGILLIVGSIVFLIGAAVGVPRVFTERDPQVRLLMLTERLRAWQIAQPLYGAGPIITAAGVAILAAASDGASRALLAAASTALAVGALAWGWSLYLRGTRVSDFAFGGLPGWPFATYVLLAIGGLAQMGFGLLTGDFRTWVAWLTLGMDVSFSPATCGSGIYRRSSSICSCPWLAWRFSDANRELGFAQCQV
jgi:hypothetical protein